MKKIILLVFCCLSLSAFGQSVEEVLKQSYKKHHHTSNSPQLLYKEAVGQVRDESLFYRNDPAWKTSSFTKFTYKYYIPNDSIICMERYTRDNTLETTLLSRKDDSWIKRNALNDFEYQKMPEASGSFEKYAYSSFYLYLHNYYKHPEYFKVSLKEDRKIDEQDCFVVFFEPLKEDDYRQIYYIGKKDYLVKMIEVILPSTLFMKTQQLKFKKYKEFKTVFYPIEIEQYIDGTLKGFTNFTLIEERKEFSPYLFNVD